MNSDKATSLNETDAETSFEANTGDDLAVHLSKREQLKRVQAGLQKFVSVALACGLILWGAFTFSDNIQSLRGNVEESVPWGIVVAFLFLTAFVPFLIGVVWIIRLLNPKSDSNSKTKG